MKKKRTQRALALALALALFLSAGALFADITTWTGHDYYRLSESEQLSLVFGMVLHSALVNDALQVPGNPKRAAAKEFYEENFSHYLKVSQVLVGIDRFYHWENLSTPLVWAYMHAIRRE